MPNTVFSDLLQHRPSKINGDDYHAGAKTAFMILELIHWSNAALGGDSVQGTIGQQTHDVVDILLHSLLHVIAIGSLVHDLLPGETPARQIAFVDRL